jgi:hypothetical protein
MSRALDTIQQFDEDTLPDLDVVTLAALELFEATPLPKLNINRFRRPLVLGSGNALIAARAIFANSPAIFADESSYEAAIFTGGVDGAYVFSASGGKHAITFARALDHRGIPTVLVTNNPTPPAAKAVTSIMPLVFPKNREPYTYNASTYMGMFLAATGEDPKAIRSFIDTHVAPAIPSTIGDHAAYFLLIPEHCSGIASMFVTKFDELFGSRVMGRVFTPEQTKHAKTVIPNERELFISFGVTNEQFGSERLHIPLPPEVGYATMMSVGYYVIGHIQKHQPPYFKEHIAEYMKAASAAFNEPMSVIVE